MLQAQCARPSRVWFHDQPTSFVMFRPDGRAFAVALRDGTVTVRDVDTGEPIGPALKHADQVQWLDFSPDGRRIVTACWDRFARVWDVATGREAVPPLEHKGRVGYAEFSPDGRLAATRALFLNTDEPTCRVWDAATGRPVTDWFGTGSGWCICFSPDSRSVAFDSGHALLIHDARTGQPVTPPMTHGHSVKVARGCFSPDGRRIVTGCLDALARVWDTTTGRQTVPAMKHAHYVEPGFFSPDGRWVLTHSADGTARVWDAATGAPRCDPMRHPAGLSGAGFSPDGTRVVTRCEAQARVWEAATGRLLLPPLGHLGLLSTARFSPDGRLVLTAGEDRTVRLWDLASASPAGPRLPELDPVYHAHFSLDGHLLITHGSSGVARVWDARTGSPTGPPLLSPSPWLSDGEISPDGRSFAALGMIDDHRSDAWVWDLETRRVTAGPLIHRFKESGGSNSPTRVVAWSPDSRTLATAAGSNVHSYPVTAVVRVWDARTGRPVTPELPYFAGVCSMNFSPDGRSLLIASGSYNEIGRPGEARVLDAATGALRFPAITTPGVCQAARFSPNGRRLITASRFATARTEGYEARIWDAATGRPLTPPIPHALPVSDAFFSPDGRLAVTVSDALRLWDAATGAPVLPPIRSGPFTRVTFSPDGRRLLAACGAEAIYATNPGFAQVFDVATGWPLTPPLWRERFVQDARFSPDGRRLVTTAWVGGALVWDLTPDDRPLENLVRSASILSGRRVDASGVAVPVETSELQEAYEALRRKDLEALSATPAQVLGWHHQQALACEKALAWEAAVVHLDRLVQASPGVEALKLRRGIAHAFLEHWREAAADFNVRQLQTSGLPDHILWYWTALVHQAAGNRDGYREACAGMLRLFGAEGKDNETPAEARHFTAWACALVPDALDDLAPALALAERDRAGQPKDPMAVQTLGALLYRAGRFEEAVATLGEAEKLPEGAKTSLTYARYFLAMAHHRLGHGDEARRFLDVANEQTDKALGEALNWNRRLTFRLLRREANALLDPGPRPAAEGEPPPAAEAGTK
jgi:WD40 repeat protein